MILIHDMRYTFLFSGRIKEVFLFDSDTTVGLGFKEAGSRKGFKLTNCSRTLVIKCFRVRSITFE